MTARFSRSCYSSEPWQEQGQVYTVLGGSWHTFTIYSNFLLTVEGFLCKTVKLYDTSYLAVEPTKKPILTLSRYFVQTICNPLGFSACQSLQHQSPGPSKNKKLSICYFLRLLSCFMASGLKKSHLEKIKYCH